MQRFNLRPSQFVITLVATTFFSSINATTAQEAPRPAAATRKPADAAKPPARKPVDAKTAKATKRPSQIKYEWRKVDFEAEKDRRYVIRYLRQGIPADSISKFRSYYTGYGFRRLIDPKFLPNIIEVRREFQRDMRDAPRGKALGALNQVAFSTLKYIASKPTYHPIARYNATLMLGDLDMRIATETREAIPMREVAPVLVGLLSPKQIDAVRVAALIGLGRHAEAMRDNDIAVLAANRRMIIGKMLSIIGEKEPPKQRSAEGHHWMRRQAVEILGAMGDVGTSGSIAKALVSAAADKESPLWFRCAAAHALGRLKIKEAGPTVIDPKKVSETLRDLAAETCRAEVQRAKTDKSAVSQAQLLADLGCIQAGITQLAAVHARKPAVADLAKKFDALYKTVEGAGGGLSGMRVESSLAQFLAVAQKVEPTIDTPKPPIVDPKKPVKPIDEVDPPTPLDTEAPGELEFE
jgi:hypothetical protein